MTPLFFLWLGQIEQQTRINDQRLQEMAESQAAGNLGTEMEEEA